MDEEAITRYWLRGFAGLGVFILFFIGIFVVKAELSQLKDQHSSDTRYKARLEVCSHALPAVVPDCIRSVMLLDQSAKTTQMVVSACKDEAGTDTNKYDDCIQRTGDALGANISSPAPPATAGSGK